MDAAPHWKTDLSRPGFPAINRDLQTEVVIIGGGLTGITTAYLLKEAGIKFVLLERGRFAGADTGHTTAHLTYVTDERLHHLVKVFGKDAAKAFWEAGAAAIDHICEIVQKLNIDCDFKWVPGFLHASLLNNDPKIRNCFSAMPNWQPNLVSKPNFSSKFRF